MLDKTGQNALEEVLRPRNKMVELVIEVANLDHNIKVKLNHFAKRYTKPSDFIREVKAEWWSDQEGIDEFLEKLHKVFHALYGEDVRMA